MARSSKHLQVRARVAVVGDGETEKVYFSNVKDTDRPADIDLFPSLPRRSGSYRDVLAQAQALAPDYMRVFALIDMDTVITDGHEPAYQVARATAEAAGIIVLENNPCFEIWLLLHFVRTGRPFANCDQVVAELRQADRVGGYEKSQRFLVRAGLYSRYRHLIETQAIPNAEFLENDRAGRTNRFPRAETFRFFRWYFSENRLQLLENGDI
jgi:hypothetical protein